MKLEDYPAAHSMDSGWFAVDLEGKIAHFDTGEAGAMPADASFPTGEAAGASEDADILWYGHILPWIARNLETADLPELMNVCALFDTAENAKNALAFGAEPVDENELMVEVTYGPEVTDYGAAFPALPGFIGFSPTSDILWEEVGRERIPIAFYSHGDWDIPGHYVRAEGSVDFTADESLRAQLETMNTRFAQADELQLADFYGNDECVSWSEGDLRTGELPARIPRESWLTKLFRMLKG